MNTILLTEEELRNGLIVEEAPSKELFQNPSHPYTLGLISSLPRVDTGSRERLVSIEGRPPVLASEPKGCPFAPRCKFRIERCRKENPSLIPVEVNHWSACWVDVKTGRARA